MKRLSMLLALVVVFAFATEAVAQIPTVTNASKLVADHPDDGVTEYWLYVVTTGPGIVPDGTSYVAQVAHTVGTTSFEWPIQGLESGKQHWAVATAYYGDMVPPVETGPSNEVTFNVVGPPSNLEVIVSQQLGEPIEIEIAGRVYRAWKHPTVGHGKLLFGKGDD